MMKITLLFKTLYYQLCDKFGRKMRLLFLNRKNKKLLNNHGFSIISQNCIGSVMYHDLNEQFRSPTINMKFEPNGFVKFCSNLPDSLKWDITFSESRYNHPTGFIQDSYISFVHYHSEEEVLSKWADRKKRVNMNNIILIACDEGMTDENVALFDNLPFHKVLFSTKPHPGIASCVNIDCFDSADARLLNFCNLIGKRYYENTIHNLSTTK